MNPPPSRTCAACRHFVSAPAVVLGPSGECRRFPPAASGENDWPVVSAGSWCGEFAPAVTQVGAAPKVSDEIIVGMVREATCELPKEEGNPAAGVWAPAAMAQASLVMSLVEDHDMSPTPAYRRIATLVKRGLLERGENPPQEKLPKARGPFVWLPTGGTPQAVAAGRPAIITESDLLNGIVAAGAVSPAAAMSMRALHREASKAIPMSVTTAHRLLGRLVAAGTVLACESGYYAAPEELP